MGVLVFSFRLASVRPGFRAQKLSARVRSRSNRRDLVIGGRPDEGPESTDCVEKRLQYCDIIS